MKTKKVVINTCFGGFGLSEAAYEKLIDWGIPVRACVEQKRDPETWLFLPQPLNDGEVIFDRNLEENPTPLDESARRLCGRYWMAEEMERTHPLLVRLVEELGEAANGKYAKLKVVEIPEDVDYEIDEYDGYEHIAEKHRTWG